MNRGISGQETPKRGGDIGADVRIDGVRRDGYSDAFDNIRIPCAVVWAGAQCATIPLSKEIFIGAIKRIEADIRYNGLVWAAEVHLGAQRAAIYCSECGDELFFRKPYPGGLCVACERLRWLGEATEIVEA